MILPVIPLTWFFGDAQVTYYFWAMLSSAVLAGSVYLIGRRWYGVCGGLLAAAALLLSNNIVFLNLSSGYPDIMSRALFCVALIFALLARERIVSRGPFPI